MAEAFRHMANNVTHLKHPPTIASTISRSSLKYNTFLKIRIFVYCRFVCRYWHGSSSQQQQQRQPCLCVGGMWCLHILRNNIQTQARRVETRSRQRDVGQADQTVDNRVPYKYIIIYKDIRHTHTQTFRKQLNTRNRTLSTDDSDKSEWRMAHEEHDGNSTCRKLQSAPQSHHSFSPPPNPLWTMFFVSYDVMHDRSDVVVVDIQMAPRRVHAHVSLACILQVAPHILHVLLAWELNKTSKQTTATSRRIRERIVRGFVC